MIGWLGFVLGVVGSILNAHKNRWCWILWILANLCLIAYSFTVMPVAYPIIVNNLVYLGINFYGIKKWKQK